MTSRLKRIVYVAAASLASLSWGCSVGPKYHTPSTPTAPAYKELTPADYKNTDGWKVAQPKDDALRGKWWEIFNEPELNALEEKVNVSNQNIAAAAASFLAARALVKEARSQLFPTVTTNPSITVQRGSANLNARPARWLIQARGSGTVNGDSDKFGIVLGVHIC